LVEPNISFDAFLPDQEYLYAEWMIDLKYLTNDLIRLLKIHRIEFKTVKHKDTDKKIFRTRQKRDRVINYQRGYRDLNDFKNINEKNKIVINQTNLVDDYYSVESVHIFKQIIYFKQLLYFLILNFKGLCLDQ
jgi:hypothetical protein